MKQSKVMKTIAYIAKFTLALAITLLSGIAIVLGPAIMSDFADAGVITAGEGVIATILTIVGCGTIFYKSMCYIIKA